MKDKGKAKNLSVVYLLLILYIYLPHPTPQKFSPSTNIPYNKTQPLSKNALPLYFLKYLLNHLHNRPEVFSI